MKKVLLGAIFSVSILGNQGIAQRNCGTMDHLAQLMAQDPNVDARMAEIEKFTENYVNENSGRAAGTVYRIPVVVHVVYNTTSQNISDAQIQSQITILNQDFRRTNADKTKTPTTFTSVAADAEIEFCMATVDPNGNPTNGITRTQTSATSFDHTDRMKSSSTGGKNAWPTDKYLNIWVCNLGGGLLGYAQFPGSGSASTDGVVIGYTYFGNMGTVTAPFNKGRTATHEVGHWLNLRHIWGDASCGSDLVSDTPTHQADNSGCPTHPKANSCGTSAEMFMNYMDYSDDGCMNMFSIGQANRMRAVLAPGGARASLTTSPGCGGSTPTTSTYCAAKGTDASYEHIKNVTLGTINNTTGSNGGYADFTSLSTSLAKGSSYTIKLTPGFASSTYTEYFSVYIDYNNNKSFADAGEKVYSGSGTVALNGTFTVPSTATTGATRMRVMMKDAAVTGPCEVYTYGEVEDYTVNIGAAATSGATSQTVTLGTGTSTMGEAPYGTYYMDERVQFIITKAELTAAGYSTTNNILKSLAWNVATASTQAMGSFTIKLSHTASSSFGSGSFISGTPTTVYSGSYTAKAGWNVHAFTTAFTYNGVDNILVDVCWNNGSYSTDSKVYYTAQSAYRTLYYRADNSTAGVCGNTSGTLSYNRPNMQLSFSSGASATSGRFDVSPETSPLAKAELNLFPNPATTQLNIGFDVAEDNSDVSIAIFNLMGAVIAEYELKGVGAGAGQHTVDLTDSSFRNLNNGIYLCSVSVNGQKETKRFVLNK